MSNSELAAALERQNTGLVHTLDHPENFSATDSTKASTALSNQANEIGMTGVTGGAQRLAIMAGDGLVQTGQGVVNTIKSEGVTGLATTFAESAVIGGGLKVLMTEAAPVGAAAALAMGVMFVGENVPKYLDAGSKALNAKTWTDMNKASDQFGNATGNIVVDSAVGFGGYHVGTGLVGLAGLGKAAPRIGAAAGEAAGAETAAAGGAREATTLVSLEAALKAQPAAAAVPAEAALHVPEAASHTADVAPETTEVERATDATKIVKKVIDKDMTVSMRELSERDPAKFQQVLDEYYPKLENAFPDASEIESKQTYHDYLHDKEFPWDMLVLRDKEGTVLGGIQSQEVTVNGQELKKAIWAEHIWLDPEARTYQNFNTLLKTGLERWKATGSDAVFMEFNDRAKMTLEQMNDDAAAGLTPEAREKIWGRVGLYVLADENGRVAPYAQPAMGDGAPVEYLSVGMAPLKSKNFDGQSLPVDDYRKLLTAAHSTIPEVDLNTDPTVLDYSRILDEIKASGQDRLSFGRLSDSEVLRLVNTRVMPEAYKASQQAADKPAGT